MTTRTFNNVGTPKRLWRELPVGMTLCKQIKRNTGRYFLAFQVYNSDQTINRHFNITRANYHDRYEDALDALMEIREVTETDYDLPSWGIVLRRLGLKESKRVIMDLVLDE